MEMKRIFIYIASAFCLLSCESYLDRQPDDQLTSENIFEKRETSFEYLVNCYTYIADESHVGYRMETCGSDEASAAYQGNDRDWALATHGVLSPNATGATYRSDYQNCYYGIHECTYFLANIDRCPELTRNEIDQWKAEARFLRAFYYYFLMVRYGPVICYKDVLPDYADESINYVDRMPWDELVQWVCGEFDAAAALLPPSWGASYQGRGTSGAALAFKAKLLLYNARPLFNGQNGTHLYDNIKDESGRQLFATVYDETKWKAAADAAKAVIDLRQYHLVGEGSITSSSPMSDVIRNYNSIFVEMTSDELIFGRNVGGSLWRQHVTPRSMGSTNGYASLGPTQKLVDCFAMANGYYPITNLEEENYDNGLGVIAIDSRSGYDETGYAPFVNPFWSNVPESGKVTDAIDTRNMYIGREARFYANVCWSGQPFVCNVTKVTTEYYNGGLHGCGEGQNWPSTGYTALKFVDTEKLGTNSDYGRLFWPMLRYADILLAYVEALIESDPASSDIFTYWNMVRSRAGLPDIEDLYPEIIGDKDLLRQYIRRERMVELCFENSRFFDMNTWMISTAENSGEVAGCNIAATSDAMDSAFWQRTSLFGSGHFGEGGYGTPRIWTEKNYLLPFNQGELDRSYNLTQNYGW